MVNFLRSLRISSMLSSPISFWTWYVGPALVPADNYHAELCQYQIRDRVFPLLIVHSTSRVRMLAENKFLYGIHRSGPHLAHRSGIPEIL